MDPMKIRSVQFIDTYFPIVDGVSETVHNYALEMDREGGCAVVCPGSKKPYDDSALPYPVIRTRIMPLPVTEYPVGWPAADRRAFPAVREFAPQILHAHSPFTVGNFALRCGKKLGIPVVSTFHSKYYDDAYNITHSREVSKFVVSRVVNHFDRADAVWACSNGTAETLRSYGYKGEIFVMDNGTTMRIPEEKFPELRAAAAERLSLPQDKHICLFVGHLIKHKNLPLILDAFRLLCDGSDDFRMVVVGDGYDGESVKKYAEKLGLTGGDGDKVIFPGRINDREQLAGVYLNADLFFFPSVYDNAPLVVREAATFGVPSLLTEGSNAAETVVKDLSGFTAKETAEDMAREIRRIFGTPGLLDRVGAEAKRTIPRSFAEVTARVRERYAEIIERYNAQKK